MGLDSECDLFIEAEIESEAYYAIQKIRRTLMSEHLGIDTTTLQNSEAEHPSLIRAIESLQGTERTLQTLNTNVTPEIDQLVPESALIDPEQPYHPDHLVNHFVPNKDKPHTARHFLKVALLLTMLLVLVAVWAGRVKRLAEYRPNDALYHLTGIAITCTLACDSNICCRRHARRTLNPVGSGRDIGLRVFAGFAYALSGALLSAVMSYWVGQWAGHGLLKRYAGNRLHRISQKLSKRGVLTIITMRIIPIAPFAVINVVAGAPTFAYGILY